MAEASVLGEISDVVDPNAVAKPDAGTPGPDANGDKTGNEGDKKAEEPAKYELKAPEGIEFEADGLNKFTTFAKDELKLPVDQAQKLMDWYGKEVQGKFETAEKAWKTTNDGWVKAAKEDKEIGGENFDKTVTAAKQVLKKFGNPALIEALNMTGFGNHPEGIRLLAKIAKAVGEDKIETGNAPTGGEKPDLAKRLFPNQN